MLQDVGEGKFTDAVRTAALRLFNAYMDSPPGITEVQIIQWYVEEGGRVEEWKPLCQYQSDKAVDDVSRYPRLNCLVTDINVPRSPRDMKGSLRRFISRQMTQFPRGG